MKPNNQKIPSKSGFYCYQYNALLLKWHLIPTLKSLLKISTYKYGFTAIVFCLVVVRLDIITFYSNIIFNLASSCSLKALDDSNSSSNSSKVPAFKVALNSCARCSIFI